MEGHGRGLVDFYVSLKNSKPTGFGHQRIEDPFLGGGGGGWLVGRPKFEKVGVASWHIRTLPHHTFCKFRRTLFTLEYGGRGADMETYPNLVTPLKTHTYTRLPTANTLLP